MSSAPPSTPPTGWFLVARPIAGIVRNMALSSTSVLVADAV